MSYAKKLKASCNKLGFLVCGFVCFCNPGLLLASDEYSFEVDDFEKKPLEINGYIEAKWDHIDINEQGALARLGKYNDPVSTIDRLTGSVQFGGSYVKGISSFNWLLKAAGQMEEGDWLDTADAFEAYASIKPNPNLNMTLGKKAYKWGKGYAWNPVGFLNRPKDPNNPEEALEGYITVEADMVKSFTGDLQNVALNTALLPVTRGINEDFGQEDNLNIAAKLYLLYADTDLDLIFYSGNSRSTRFGFDFSKNIASNFEVHGEYAYLPDLEKTYLEEDGSSVRRKDSAQSFLLGFRYLNEFNLTSIVEYYHNGAGYSQEELEQFYQLIDDGTTQLSDQGIDNILREARKLGLQGYSKPYLGTDYLYARFSLKEPWDIVYFIPALTAIVNLDDQSYSLTPELLYTGFTNWELRLKFAILEGSEESEYGEKINDSKLELRARYFF